MELKTVGDVQVHLEELWGRQLATEFAVKILIDSHPDRAKASQVWDQALAYFVDHLMEFPVFAESELVREKAHDQLANYGGLLK